MKIEIHINEGHKLVISEDGIKEGVVYQCIDRARHIMNEQEKLLLQSAARQILENQSGEKKTHTEHLNDFMESESIGRKVRRTTRDEYGYIKYVEDK